jgi:hypothetical protein
MTPLKLCAALNCGITINVVNDDHIIKVLILHIDYFAAVSVTKTLPIKCNFSQTFIVNEETKTAAF